MSFQNVFNNAYSRTFGGTKKGTADPFIGGYFGVYFTDIPESLKLDNMAKDISSQSSSKGSSVATLLSASCLSLNVPSVTLNKTTFNGIGSKKWAVPTNIDVGDSISLRFMEYSGLPIAKIFYHWVNAIRNIRHMASALKDGTYTKSNYSCSIYYWITNPSMNPSKKDIEVAFCFTGCFPDKAPIDAFNADVGTNDKVEHDITFNVDEVFCSLDPEQEWVATKCVNIMQTLKWDDIKKKLVSGEFGGPTNK